MDNTAIKQLALAGQSGGTLLPVKVVPGASRTRIAGVLGERLKITVSQAPEKGAANKAVGAVLAGALGLRKNEVELAVGPTSAEKTFLIRGLGPEDVRQRLAGLR